MSIFIQSVNVKGKPLPALIGNRGSGAGEVLHEDNDGWGGESREWVKENTLESILFATRCGLKWIKVEVCLSKDAEVMVSGNPMFAKNKSVIEYTAEELKDLGILRLWDIFETIPEEIGFLVEVKHVFEDLDGFGTAESVAKILIRENIVRPKRQLVVYGSEASASIVIKHIIKDHDIHLAYHAGSSADLVGMLLSAKRFGLKIVVAYLDSMVGDCARAAMAPYSLSDLIDEAHQDGIELVALCPNVEESVFLIHSGIDGLVIDNVPGMTLDLGAIKPIKNASKD